MAESFILGCGFENDCLSPVLWADAGAAVCLCGPVPEGSRPRLWAAGQHGSRCLNTFVRNTLQSRPVNGDAALFSTNSEEQTVPSTKPPLEQTNGPEEIAAVAFRCSAVDVCSWRSAFLLFILNSFIYFSAIIWPLLCIPKAHTATVFLCSLM